MGATLGLLHDLHHLNLLLGQVVGGHGGGVGGRE